MKLLWMPRLNRASVWTFVYISEKLGRRHCREHYLTKCRNTTFCEVMLAVHFSEILVCYCRKYPRMAVRFIAAVSPTAPQRIYGSHAWDHVHVERAIPSNITSFGFRAPFHGGLLRGGIRVGGHTLYDGECPPTLWGSSLLWGTHGTRVNLTM